MGVAGVTSDVSGGSGPIWSVQVDPPCPPVLVSWHRLCLFSYSMFEWSEIQPGSLNLTELWKTRHALLGMVEFKLPPKLTP
jgi:hypothetical protein